jgi:hypothetical protein
MPTACVLQGSTELANQAEALTAPGVSRPLSLSPSTSIARLYQVEIVSISSRVSKQPLHTMFSAQFANAEEEAVQSVFAPPPPTMCTQTHLRYLCGCKQKGEFEQCDRLYDLGVNLQCAVPDTKDKIMRSYCATHLLKEGKAAAVFQISKRPGPSAGPGENAGAGEHAEEA